MCAAGCVGAVRCGAVRCGGSSSMLFEVGCDCEVDVEVRNAKYNEEWHFNYSAGCVVLSCVVSHTVSCGFFLCDEAWWMRCSM